MRKGMRPIRVAGQSFRWRFDGRLVVIPAGRSGPQLYVDWGWRDWFEPEGPGPEPHIVTPRFVSAAIRFALAKGWQPELNGPRWRLTYRKNAFARVLDEAVVVQRSAQRSRRGQASR